MKTVHLCSTHFSVFQYRQTPSNDGVWGDFQFCLEKQDTEANWLVVYDRHAEPLVTKVPKDRRILMVSEPPEFQNYPQAYLDQFGYLLAPYNIEAFKGRQIIGHTALPWFYGMNVGGGGDQHVSKHWSDLMQPTRPTKDRTLEISAICSTKTQTKNQIRRLRFLRILQEQLGDRLKIFGRGFEPLNDKAEIIENSRYHLALENNLLPHGWTEKTADSILGGAFLIHGGAEQIQEDFDADGLLWIDLTQPHQAAAKVKACLDNQIAEGEAAQRAMQANKERLMLEHNLFAVLAEHIKRLSPDVAKIEPLPVAEPVIWHKKSKSKQLLKLPRPLRRLVWRAQIAINERN